MQTREIPKASWAHVLEAIANRKAHQPISVRLEGLDVGDQPLAEHLPLVGISCEEKGSEANAIEITLSRQNGQDNLTHMIANPARIYLAEGDGGEIQSIDIESDAKVKTLIFFEG